MYEIRDELHSTLRGCADNVKVEVYMEGYLYIPITIKSGSGGNKLTIHTCINEWGHVEYRWDRETWGKHFRNACDTVKSITRNIISSVGSFFGRLFGSNKSIEGPSRGRLTYYWLSKFYVKYLKTLMLLWNVYYNTLKIKMQTIFLNCCFTWIHINGWFEKNIVYNWLRILMWLSPDTLKLTEY